MLPKRKRKNNKNATKEQTQGDNSKMPQTATRMGKVRKLKQNNRKRKEQFCQRNLMKYIVCLLSMNITVMAIIIIPNLCEDKVLIN